MIEQIFGVTADTTMDVGNTITCMLVAAVFGLVIGGVYFAVCKKEQRILDIKEYKPCICPIGCAGFILSNV